jgi:hypothetical protein
VEERVFHVKLVDKPIARRSEMKNGVNGHRFDDQGECMAEVDPWSLLKATNDPPGLATLEGTVGLELVLEHPFPGDHVHARRM